MFLSMMMTLAADNLHVGIFGGWNGFKFKLPKDISKEDEKKNKMFNTGIFGGELGWRIFVMNKFFIDPTLSIGYAQKSISDDKEQDGVSEEFAEETRHLRQQNKIVIKQLPIHFILKTGYAINDAMSVYGLVGGGVNVLWDSTPASKTETKGDFTAGAGLAFYFKKYISVFAEYRFARTFIKDTGLNSNRVVGGLQFNF